jgi:hypothetical protein
MTSVHDTVPLLTPGLTRFARLGYCVQPIAMDTNLVELPRCSRIALRFAQVKAPDGQAMFTADASFDLREDSSSEVTRRWKISRAFRPRGNCPWISLDAVLTVRGGLSSAFSSEEARACRDMLRTSLDDAAVSIAGLPSSITASPSAGPTAIVDIRAVGDFVTCRSGFIRRGDLVFSMSSEQRDAMIAFCERFLRDILSEIELACRQTDSVTSSERKVSALEPAGVYSGGVISVQPHTVTSTQTGEARAMRDTSSKPSLPQTRGRHVQ